MEANIKRLIKKILPALPKPMQAYLFERGRRLQNSRYFRQGSARIRIGDFELDVPAHHPLPGLLKAQPYRDMSVGIVAKYIAEKYPNGSVVDIGANIGDTAAMIARYSNHKLILVEPSDYFFGYLERNVRQFQNEVIVKKAMVSTGRSLAGSLHHHGGTAYFHESPDGQREFKTERLRDMSDPNTHFVKIDTDGYDVEILADSLDWLEAQHPAVVFENGVEDDQDLAAANALFDELGKIGYRYFMVWDDPGFHLVSTTSIEVLKDLNRYLFKLKQHRFARAVSNFDVLGLHRDDEDIYESVRAWYQSY
jgi:FkbM family methyltransferase